MLSYLSTLVSSLAAKFSLGVATLALLVSAGGVLPEQSPQPASAAVAPAQQAQPAESAGTTLAQSPAPAVIYKYITQPAPTGTVLGASTGPDAPVTQDQLASAILSLTGALASKLTPATAATPEYVAAGGNPDSPYAAGQHINNLANVTVSGVSGLTAGDIPTLPYLSTSGGTLSGLTNFTNASTSLFSVFNNAYFGGTATSSFDSTGALILATPLLVSSGGTGANTFGQGWLYSNGGTSALAASTSPTVNYVTATSTTATSTFAGGFAVKTSGLVYDYSTNRVGIGTASPGYKLDVSASTNATTGGSNFAQEVFFSAAPTSAANGNYIGLFGETNYNSSFENGSGGTVIGVRGEGFVSNARSGGVAGIDGIAVSNSSNTAALTTSLYGGRFQSQNTGTGRITHGIGFKVNSPTNSGTVDIEFGGYIAAISGGTQNSALHIEGAGSGNAITFAGDGSASLNSKIYSSSANQLNIEASSNLLLNSFGGTVGIATTSPWRTLSVTGTVGFDGLGAITGTNSSLCLDSNKQVMYSSNSDSCASSLRATKHDISPLTIDALAQAAALEPVSFIYNNDASSTVRYGFIAEDAAAVDSHLGTYDQSGALSGIDDRSFLAIIVGALKQLSSQISDMALNIVSAHVTADVGDFKEVNTDKLCVGSTCVTEAQFQQVFGAGASSVPTPPPVVVEENPPIVVQDEKATTTAEPDPALAEEPPVDEGEAPPVSE